MDFAQRDALVAAFRAQVYAQAGLTLFPHQADWQLASEGWTLLPHAPRLGDRFTDVLVPAATVQPGTMVMARSTVNLIPCATIRRAIAPRPSGPAHILADLAAYKAGKSYGAAAWLAGFAILPDAQVHILGMEYSIAEPEFTYLADFLLSDRGMRMKPVVYQNDKRAGRMRIKLRTGANFEVKSYERKEGLKGKRLVCYCFCEAYQFPGLECFTTLAQNLRELRGYALFPTTADRPWVGVFHDLGHGADPDWHCVCNTDAHENPYTFDQRARDRDDPTKGGIMTRERFAISWQGKLGSFIGRVYDCQRGDPAYIVTPESHPAIWMPQGEAA